MIIEQDILGCAHDECDGHVEFGGCSPELFGAMFGGDKLVASAYMALQIGWGLVPTDGVLFAYCPAHLAGRKNVIRTPNDFDKFFGNG